MNKHLVILALFLAAFASLFIACSTEVSEYVRPQFGVISYAPRPAQRGDSLELTVPHKVKGNGIAQTTYTWTVKDIGWDEESNASKDTVITIEDNYDGYGKQDPRMKFLLPEDCPVGTHEVTMTATFSVYIGSTLFDKINVRGNIVVE